MIYNNLYVETFGTAEPVAVVKGNIFQDNIPVLEQNYVEKMALNNGFTKQRMFRKIASIPDTAELVARQKGWNLDDPKELYKFLEQNPDYMTVEHINSRRSPNIIIK